MSRWKTWRAVSGVLALALLWAVCVVAAYPAYAAENSSVTIELSVDQSPQAGEEAAVSFYVSAQESLDFACVRLVVQYDQDKMTFEGIQQPEDLPASAFQTEDSGGNLTVLYVDTAGVPLQSGERYCLFTAIFQLRSQAQPGDSITIQAQADGAGTKQLQALTCVQPEPVALMVADAPSTRLTSLTPDHGSLVPAFSPDVTSYTLRVAPEVERVIFEAQSEDPLAQVRVNRKTLGAYGSNTRFTVTVTSSNGKYSRVYEVQVYRMEKEEEAAVQYDCRLSSLVPQVGTLVPAFSPDNLQYSLTVPSSVERVEFEATAVDPQASVRVNRKTLGKMGSDTDFTITVKAPSGSQRLVYSVRVHRQARATAGAAVSSKSSSSRRNSSASSQAVAIRPEQSQIAWEQEQTLPTAAAPGAETLVVREDNFGVFLFGFFLCLGGIAALMLLAWFLWRWRNKSMRKPRRMRKPPEQQSEKRHN
ncbi:MAG TPA: cadherin-like beta sandwich domain-containing protein [Candidatus Gallacutalibacter stercoravium]|nr:cadherin-like beta sandwich domain-containing protein [Candidatus Gallacutalibacter stercoravium]